MTAHTDLVTVPGPTGVAGLFVGQRSACALDGTGEIWCWGANNLGQMGDSTTTNVTSPKNVVGITNVTKIGVGDDHSCALDAAGEVYCWGGNYDGQVGNNQTVFVTTPQKVIPSGATDLVVGARSTCAKVGAAWQCWGRNVEGQLATGTDAPLAVPTPIAAFASATKVVPGSAIACTMTASDIACAGDVSAIGTGDNSAAFPKAPMLPSCQ
jgi:alpha-tubulin suppressor-like RCC1 family protein